MIVYTGPEREGLVSSVYEWLGDVFANRPMRRIGNGERVWIVPVEDTLFCENAELCPECLGDGFVAMPYQVNYGPQPEVEGEWIQTEVEFFQCETCRGTGLKVDWGRALRVQRYPLEE